LLQPGRRELGLQAEQPPAVEHGAHGLAKGGLGATESLVEAGVCGELGDHVSPGDDHQVSARAGHLLEHLPGEAVLGEDEDADAPLLASGEDRLDLEQQLVEVGSGDALAQGAEAGVQFRRGSALGEQGVRTREVEEGILERGAIEKDGCGQAVELGDGDAGVGARGHERTFQPRFYCWNWGGPPANKRPSVWSQARSPPTHGLGRGLLPQLTEDVGEGGGAQGSLEPLIEELQVRAGEDELTSPVIHVYAP
jgi:hypothetical protein